jgi:pyruvate/2-oxoglutarate dehydrogenase complex dihydrolipoamide dehydrogenase (E3) component
MKKFDHIIVGTGQATGTLLGKLIPSGDSIAVIEGAKVGGSCVNYGCTPTKALVASARAIHMAKRGSEFGFTNKPVEVNYSRIRERMDGIRNASNKGLIDWFKSTDNVRFIRGWASFKERKIIEIGDEEIGGKNIYINTGTRPLAPPIEGLENIPWMDSAGILDLESLPDHLLIIGGGYIGMEFAQIYKRFGSEVTVIQQSKRVMPREDEDVSEAIQEILEEEGIQILCNAEAKAVTQKNGSIELSIEVSGREKKVAGSHLLIAAGRKPNTEKLNLQNAGINANNKGFIEVDDFCRTNIEGVYALGDVNGRGAFTHTSVNDAEVVLDHMTGGKRKISSRIPIYALFTDPPLGRVGLSEKDALAQGKRILRATHPMNKISRAKEMSETRGFAKLIVDADTDMILGASILGPGGDEIINMFAAIMHSQVPCHEYRRVVLVHPTVSELMPFILDGLEEVSE